MFALPEHDRQAFFALMDEYFSQRPQYAPANFHAAPAAAPSSTTTAAAAKPPPPPRRGNSVSRDSPAAASPPPPTSAGVHRGVQKPAGLQTGKVRVTLTQSIGFLRTDSPGAALGSVVNKTTNVATTAVQNKMNKSTGASQPPDYYSGAGAPAPPAAASAAPPTPPARAAATAQTPPGEEAVALYAFAGTEPGDLHVEQGEHIYLLESISDDWWRAQSLDGARTGIVPTTYVQTL